MIAEVDPASSQKQTVASSKSMVVEAELLGLAGQFIASRASGDAVSADRLFSQLDEKIAAAIVAGFGPIAHAIMQKIEPVRNLPYTKVTSGMCRDI